MKKLVMFVLAIMMLALPVMAMAVNSESALVTACGASGTVKLTGDIVLLKSIKIENGVSVTLDLNGHKLTGPDDGSSNWYAFIVEKGGKLILEDNSAAQTGELWAKCYGVETKGGTFIMNSGKITATNNKTLGAAIVNYGGTVIVNGGTLTAAVWAINSQSYFASATLEVNGGTLESQSDTEGTITIGGEFSKNTNTDTVRLKGGTVKGKTAIVNNADADNVTISGGSYSTRPSDVTYQGDFQLVNGMWRLVKIVNADLPQTGDAENLMMWVALMGMACVGLAMNRKLRRN